MNRHFTKEDTQMLSERNQTKKEYIMYNSIYKNPRRGQVIYRYPVTYSA